MTEPQQQPPPMSFEAVMAPLGATRFREEYLGRKPLHLEGPADKWAGVMGWDVLNRLLGMTTVWSQSSLVLVLDKEPIPFAAFASPAPGRDGGQVLRPEPEKVKGFLARGATLVLNDIDQLDPGLSAFSRAVEEALGCKLQANLYLSSKRRQGFRAHFDFHDVFAVHAMGEKTWAVFEGRADAPIPHPAFQGLPQEHHERAKGALWREVRLRPGDLLYLPRGQYHYALADEGPCVHVAFGATYPIGLDVAAYLFERLVHEPLARANLPPRGDGPEALRARLAELGGRVRALLGDEQALRDMAALQAGFRYPRETYDLPGLIERAGGGAHGERFRLKARGLRLVEQGGKVGLVKEGVRGAVEVPPALGRMLAWTLEREGGFARAELAAAFPAEGPARIDRFLADIARMGVVESGG